MFRPVLAFATLCLAAFLLAPTVASVHGKVTELHIMRETPWSIFEWDDPPSPRLPLPDCGGSPKQLYSEIIAWPERIQKDEPFALSGIVQSEQEGRIGVATIEVDLFLNETKSKPGTHLGTVESGPNGYFQLSTSVPFDLQASRYHLVAHAKEKRIHCDRYLEHWSDPETDIVSSTRIVWLHPDVMVAGRNGTYGGRLVDVVGAPVINATVDLTIGGKEHRLATDGRGEFVVPYTPSRAGELELEASYEGSDHYEATADETTLDVEEELFEMEGGSEISLPRSTLTPIRGHVYVADDAREDTFTLRFDGVQVATCPDCPATSELTLELGEDGAFAADLYVPSDADPGRFDYTASGGGLERSYPGNLTLHVQPVLTLDARSTGLFTRGYEGTINLTDEVGRPLAMPVALAVGDQWTENATGADGLYVFGGSTDTCGARAFQARFNGSDTLRPAAASTDASVCGFLAFIPPWLLAVPWWVWPLGVALAFAAWHAARAWRQRYAPVIMGGPPLTFTFTEPRDEAAGFAAIGEAVVASAFLEEPLPDGHRLRIGSPRRTEERPLDADLRAHYHLVPDKLGDLPLRAEILDPKGRVVSRRTLTLHVVRYAEEIETRYLALRSAHGASEAVTPRELERWLHERAPGIDPEVARRLVRVFEEADYSPRVAGRAEFSAYMSAEKGVQEVTAPVAA